MEEISQKLFEFVSTCLAICSDYRIELVHRGNENETRNPKEKTMAMTFQTRSARSLKKAETLFSVSGMTTTVTTSGNLSTIVVTVETSQEQMRAYCVASQSGVFPVA